MKIANAGESLNLLEMTHEEYQEKVLDYLEYIGYPELVNYFEAEDVAESLAKTIARLYILNISFRKCAIVIFSLTMEYQVKRYAEHLVNEFGLN